MIDGQKDIQAEELTTNSMDRNVGNKPLVHGVSLTKFDLSVLAPNSNTQTQQHAACTHTKVDQHYWCVPCGIHTHAGTVTDLHTDSCTVCNSSVLILVPGTSHRHVYPSQVRKHLSRTNGQAEILKPGQTKNRHRHRPVGRLPRLETKCCRGTAPPLNNTRKCHPLT